MDFPFEWNGPAGQPHNVAPRRERLRHHLHRAPSYLRLVWSDLRKVLPVLILYKKLRRSQYLRPVDIGRACSVSVSPPDGGPEAEDSLVRLLKDTGCRQTLVRIPSWERDKLERYAGFLERLKAEGFDVMAALLQCRKDVQRPVFWQGFIEEVFDRLAGTVSFFEVGHAWNRTKWGVWDFEEYLDLAAPAFELAREHNVRLVGPAVIDFEFHLYPPTLARQPFDKVSSLLYVDRVGAPENGQAGWTTADKIALLKAVVDVCATGGRDLWVTEVNWPLRGTGSYSPASGRPNVSEEEQADFLVRYYLFCLASGFVERVYWWQLLAPGYGLVDSRTSPWRRRPSCTAFKTLVGYVDNSRFLGREAAREREAHIFRFFKEGHEFAVCWSSGRPLGHRFNEPIGRVEDRDGRELRASGSDIIMDGSPRYVFFS
ncbi:MAG: hypothetical protein WCB96_05060 [Candidatus Aminicenantales bacterium]